MALNKLVLSVKLERLPWHEFLDVGFVVKLF